MARLSSERFVSIQEALLTRQVTAQALGLSSRWSSPLSGRCGRPRPARRARRRRSSCPRSRRADGEAGHIRQGSAAADVTAPPYRASGTARRRRRATARSARRPAPAPRPRQPDRRTRSRSGATGEPSLAMMFHGPVSQCPSTGRFTVDNPLMQAGLRPLALAAPPANRTSSSPLRPTAPMVPGWQELRIRIKSSRIVV